MLTIIDEDEFETVSEHRTCEFHKSHPRETFAGCTCSSSISSVRRSPDAVAAIKANRQREYENKILGEAEAIRARRES